MTPAGQIQAARTELVLMHRFFARGALNLDMRATNAVPTMATDGITLWYSPAFVTTLTRAECVAVLAHEVMHCLLLHPARIGDREHERANAAMDYAINKSLVQDGFSLPAGGLVDARFDGMSWERIYTMLPDTPCAPSMGAIIFDGAKGKEVEARWGRILRASLAQGDAPAGLSRELDAGLRPRETPWYDLLLHLLETTSRGGADDLDFRRPSSRGAATGIFMPTWREQAFPPLAVAIDTSGSMSAGDLQLALGHVRAVADMLRPEVIHICCADADVAAQATILRDDETDGAIHLRGGGDTDFRPACIWAEQLYPAPRRLIYISDMAGTFPVRCEVPTVWLSTTLNATAPFGEVIYIGETP